MDRKGISFTLTIVVAGVILLMTALSVVTLGGSSISNFFNTLSGQQQQAVTQAEVRQACNQRAEQIQTQYCSGYVRSTYNGDASALDECPADPDYSSSAWTPRCSDTVQTQSAKSCQKASDGDPARTVRASEQGCPWRTYSGFSPTVNVRGSTFNCIDEGYLSESCPVQ